MTTLMSGINMYSMALVMKVVLGWDLNLSIWLTSLVVAGYVALGGLRSAIFNEILQFVLIWAGALLIPILGMIEVGGWLKSTWADPTTCTCGAVWDISIRTRWAFIGRALSSAGALFLLSATSPPTFW
jgi:Na+/pantothenate symporter